MDARDLRHVYRRWAPIYDLVFTPSLPTSPTPVDRRPPPPAGRTTAHPRRWGMVFTMATWFFLGPQLAIKFGILYFIGVSVAISYPFLRRRWLNLALGIGFFP